MLHPQVGSLVQYDKTHHPPDVKQIVSIDKAPFYRSFCFHKAHSYRVNIEILQVHYQNWIQYNEYEMGL